MTFLMTSNEFINFNISATFVELIIATLDAWNTESERVLLKTRGGDAPYRIRNLTGTTLNIWSDQDDDSKRAPAKNLAQGQVVLWRFDDWRTTREVS